MTEEHKAKIKAGIERKKAEREAQKAQEQPKNDEISEKVNQLSDKLDKLVDIVAGIVNVEKEEKKEEVVTPQEQIAREQKIDSKDFLSSLPSEWRKIVDKYLGENFLAKVRDSSGGNFLLEIYIPKEYDRRVGDRIGEHDISVGQVRRASAIQDVEYWSKLVRANLELEAKKRGFNLKLPTIL